MASPFQKWLTSDEPATDVYQVVSLARLHPAREEVRTAIRTSNRALHSYQQHSNPAILQRARQLQMLLAEAEQALASDAAWSNYETQVIDALLLEFQAKSGPVAANWQLENLRRWLEAVQEVHPSRTNEVIQHFKAEAHRTALAQPAPEPHDEAATQTAPSAKENAALPVPRRRRPNVADSSPEVLTAPIVAAEVQPAMPSAQAPAAQVPQLVVATTPAPLPNAILLHSKPTKQGHATQARQTRRQGAEPAAGEDHTVLWIVGAAIISGALILLLVGAIVATGSLLLGIKQRSPKPKPAERAKSAPKLEKVELGEENESR